MDLVKAICIHTKHECSVILTSGGGVSLYRQHSQSRENINFPEDDVVAGAEREGVGEFGSSPSPGRIHASNSVCTNIGRLYDHSVYMMLLLLWFRFRTRSSHGLPQIPGSRRDSSPISTYPITGQATLPRDDEPVNMTITAMSTGSKHTHASEGFKMT